MSASDDIAIEEIDELLRSEDEAVNNDKIKLSSDGFSTQKRSKAYGYTKPRGFMPKNRTASSVYWVMPVVLCLVAGGGYLLMSESSEPDINVLTSSSDQDIDMNHETNFIETPAWQAETANLYGHIESLEARLGLVERAVETISPLEAALYELAEDYKADAKQYRTAMDDLQLEWSEFEDDIDRQLLELEQQRRSAEQQESIGAPPPLQIDVIGWVRWGSKVLLSINEKGKQRLLDIGDRVGPWRLTQMSGVEQWVQFQHVNGVSQRLSVEV